MLNELYKVIYESKNTNNSSWTDVEYKNIHTNLKELILFLKKIYKCFKWTCKVRRIYWRSPNTRRHCSYCCVTTKKKDNLWNVY